MTPTYKVMVNFKDADSIVKENLEWYKISDYLDWLENNTDWLDSVTSIEITREQPAKGWEDN